jgi:very-short-patch-repair endonuclease
MCSPPYQGGARGGLKSNKNMKLFNQTQLKEKRKELRNNSTLSEKILWSKLKRGNQFNIKFRRQNSIGNYIVDFYCTD